ncbi:family 43 glycosylhydrolase [Deinococcus apachensis]|uniref:family 43 glycosylhydrolase n=1 Tax=Deinococcus apachensis TaxID=309886 RepID=UPI000376FCBC|nr:family 43 glycosylhydrolase [Deinococcus apachensis]
MQTRRVLLAPPLLGALLLTSCGRLPLPQFGRTYTNPPVITKADGSRVESCADPDIIRGPSGDANWYLYCTTDPHSANDRDAQGNLNFHLISMAKSSDLVNWTYVGDAFSSKPGWVKDDAGLWAPEVQELNGKYLLYYTASDTRAGGSAIGVATGPTPTGPWTDSGTPVVEPQPPPGGNDPKARRWVFDPEVVTDDSGNRWMYYGSYFGGISVRKLSADGLRTDPANQKEVALDNRYEGSQVVRHGGYYYLMLSATNCCNGPLSGYSVFAGRSASPTGPFYDKDGVSLMDPRVGGTPVISMNGNRWVGPGHNAVFQDAAGRDWTVYHAIDRFDSYIDVGRNINKRPMLLDPLDWVDGWPTVRGGAWASEGPQPAPAVHRWERAAPPSPVRANDQPGAKLDASSDEFSGNSLDPRWTWVRPPTSGAAGLDNGVFRFDTQSADLFEDTDNASILTEQAPPGDYLVEVKLNIDLPDEGCCFNYSQGGLVIYGDDDRFLKAVVFSNWNTRQIEFAKEVQASAPGFPRYGNTVLASPGRDTWLRIARRAVGNEETYTGYSSRDGVHWTRGGTWTHALGQARIGLVSMGGKGFTTRFDYVRVYRLAGP